MHTDINTLIDTLKLKPHPEGGFYREIYRSTDRVQVPKERYGDDWHFSSTSIYFLITSDDFSAWHRVKSDETWYYHEGSSINTLMISPTGELSQKTVGSVLRDSTANYQVTIPANHWFCAYVKDSDSYSLVGCNVSPGFEFTDFQLADRSQLIQEYPQHEEIIRRYTRST